MSNYLSNFVKRLADSSLCELVELFGNQVCWPALDSCHHYRNRVFNQCQTFWIFVGQVLSYSQSCCEALRKAQAWLWHKKKKDLTQHIGLLSGTNPT